MPGHRRRVQASTCHKLFGGQEPAHIAAANLQTYETDEKKGRIIKRCLHRLLILPVNDQRNNRYGNQDVEQLHGAIASRIGKAVDQAVRHQVKSKELHLILFPGHVFKGKKSVGNPADGGQRDENPRQAILPQEEQKSSQLHPVLQIHSPDSKKCRT